MHSQYSEVNEKKGSTVNKFMSMVTGRANWEAYLPQAPLYMLFNPPWLPTNDFALENIDWERTGS